MCPGSIYIELINRISEVICDYEALHDISEKLYDKLRKGDTQCFFVYFTEDECSIDKKISNAITYVVCADEYEFDGIWVYEYLQKI